MRRQVIAAALVGTLALVGCTSQPAETVDDTPAVEEEAVSEEVDKSDLKELVEEVESTTLEGLRLTTGTNLSNAYEEAVTVMNDEGANQPEIDGAERALISAFDRATRESEAYETAVTATEETPREEPEEGAIGEGTHLVGTDIEAGEYKLTATSDIPGYWKVTESSAPDADIIGNDNFNGSTYVTVTEGQYLTINRCTGEKVN